MVTPPPHPYPLWGRERAGRAGSTSLTLEAPASLASCRAAVNGWAGCALQQDTLATEASGPEILATGRGAASAHRVLFCNCLLGGATFVCRALWTLR